MNTIDVVRIRDDDTGYLRWLSQNPEGFVVNMFRTEAEGYRVLHRAECHTIGAANSRVKKGGFTERDYIKFCAIEVSALKRQFGSTLRGCSKCRPNGQISAGAV